MRTYPPCWVFKAQTVQRANLDRMAYSLACHGQVDRNTELKLCCFRSVPDQLKSTLWLKQGKVHRQLKSPLGLK